MEIFLCNSLPRELDLGDDKSPYPGFPRENIHYPCTRGAKSRRVSSATCTRNVLAGRVQFVPGRVRSKEKIKLINPSKLVHGACVYLARLR